ncbi:MAG TPA: GAF domain-containing protein, partial [Kofleriaceae bacterium]
MNAEGLHRLPAALFEIGKLIGSELEPGVLLSRIAELICQLISARACSVMLLDADRTRLLARAAYGVRTERMQSLSFRIGEGVAGWVALHGEPALIADVTADPRFIVLPGNQTPIGSMLCVPLIARGERVGVVNATSERPAAFDDDHLELVRFV